MTKEEHQCPRCGEVKPVSEYPAGGVNRFARCSVCKADEMRAYKAGIRVDKCATCGASIAGLGVCSRCRDALDQLGGSEEALKRAVKVIRWLHE